MPTSRAFLESPRKSLLRLKSIESPEVLTVNGQASLVIQGITGYQALLDRLEYAERLAGIRRGKSAPARAKAELPEESEELSRG